MRSLRGVYTSQNGRGWHKSLQTFKESFFLCFAWWLDDCNPCSFIVIGLSGFSSSFGLSKIDVDYACWCVVSRKNKNVVHNLHVTSVHGMKTSSIICILPFC